MRQKCVKKLSGYPMLEREVANQTMLATVITKTLDRFQEINKMAT